MMAQATLRLFVTGGTPLSAAAVARLRELEQQLPPDYLSAEIIDVLQNPDFAEADRVLATPTLIRLSPLPMIRLVGDLESVDRLMQLLDLLQTPPQVN
ncbi:MAG: circadian clock KaiB family protein [Bryobacterales bacterium]|nr:circadian clock KaiB family protein [Bryobacterales bacterium]